MYGSFELSHERLVLHPDAGSVHDGAKNVRVPSSQHDYMTPLEASLIAYTASDNPQMPPADGRVKKSEL